MSLLRRFLDKTDRNGECWGWTAAKCAQGYGKIAINSKPQKAHRVAMTLAGQDPSGLCVLHQCDNPGCVRPSHLRLGTQGENVQEAWDRGRAKPNRKGNPKHSDATVAFVRNMKELGVSVRQAAIAAGVSYAQALRWTNMEARV